VPGVALAAQPSCGDTITTSTTLKANLDCTLTSGRALTIGADNVVLDLNGYSILGPGIDDGSAGVYVYGFKKTKITNGLISGYTAAVTAEHAPQLKVTWIDVFGLGSSQSLGVRVDEGNATVINHVTTMAVQWGVMLTHSAATQVKNSRLKAEGQAISVSYGSHDVFSANTLRAEYGVYDEYGQKQTYQNNVSIGSEWGFYFSCGGQGTVKVAGNSALGSFAAGFLLDQCFDPTAPAGTVTKVIGNTAADGDGAGFRTGGSFNEVWKNNLSYHNIGSGFYFEEPGHFVIEGNTALRNGVAGFYVPGNDGIYNAYSFSQNVAKRNHLQGFNAQFPAPGSGNIGKRNGGGNCFNVVCI